LDAYFASPLALCARRVSSAASRLLGSTSLRFALHGWQRRTGPKRWGPCIGRLSCCSGWRCPFDARIAHIPVPRYEYRNCRHSC
ncbi:hypothetical protein, partial [Thiolapillus sp.]|uniref:hypothetical protein n=1 Tax=Thiolapillus sp. TaxID=2017437 RepID=UPI003AF9908C